MFYYAYVKLRYNYRVYPTEEQGKFLESVFGSTRYAYNWGINIRSKAYTDGKKISYHQSSALWTKHKKENPWLYEVPCIPTQQALRNLQTAYDRFFKKQSKYPSYKKKNDKQSAEFTSSGFQMKNGQLHVAKMGKLKVCWSRKLPSEPSTATIAKNADGRYFVSFIVDKEINPLQKTGKSVGIDLGILSFATLSDGMEIKSQKITKRVTEKTKILQKRLSKKQKGSKRRDKARVKLARHYSRIKDRRHDFNHKITTKLVNDYDLIAIEDLNVRGMMANHKLSRVIGESSFHSFRSMLTAKAGMYGKEVVEIDRFFPSSKMCSDCGHVNGRMSLGIRSWKCSECGVDHNRDLNAAKNILSFAVGQTVYARGANVRVKKDSPSIQFASKREPLHEKSGGISLL